MADDAAMQQRGVVRLDRSPATIVAVCSECPWRVIRAGYQREARAHDAAARHALAHDDERAKWARDMHRRRSQQRAAS